MGKFTKNCLYIEKLIYLYTMSIYSKEKICKLFVITDVLGHSKQNRPKNYFVSVQDFGHCFVFCG